MNKHDRTLLILAVVGFAFIGFMIILNQNGTQKTFETGAYYTSDESITLGQHGGSSYDSLTSTSRSQCPGIDNIEPLGTRVSIAGISAWGNKLGLVYLPYTKESLAISYKTLNKSNLSSALSFDSGNLVVAETPIGDSFYEIIAPFSFSFETYNVDNTGTIQIVNKSNSCRMIVENPVNWYCAGVYGSTTKYSNVEEAAEWIDHDQHHLTKIGLGSQTASGSAGSLLGYGGSSTVIKFQIFTVGGWQDVSQKMVILGKE